MIPHIRDLDGPPEVGRYYRVPCVVERRGAVLPVFDSPHRDPELGVGEIHRHFDLRFISDRVIQEGWGSLDIAFGGISIAARVELRRRRCFRAMPVFPLEYAHGDIFSRFFRSYQGQGLREGRCPHRGFPAKDMARVRCDERDVLVCPWHGLCFDAETGRVVPPINQGGDEL